MPVGRETLDRTLYKSSTEQLHMRAVEERIYGMAKRRTQ